MLRIYKDKDIKVVTNGAYEQLYKPLGYNIIIENTKRVKENKIDKENNDINNEQKRSSSNKKNKNMVDEY